jgi:hypothetical protein
VAEAVEAERADADRRTARAVQEALRRETAEAAAARAVQAAKEVEEKQRREAARAVKAEAQQHLAERELELRAQFASALEAQDVQYRVALAEQEAQHRAALEALQAEYSGAVLRAQGERAREAALKAEEEEAAVNAAAERQGKEVYHALVAEARTVGTVVEREDPEDGAAVEPVAKRARRQIQGARRAEDAERRARKADAARAVIAKAAALLRSRGVQPSTFTEVGSKEPVGDEGAVCHSMSTDSSSGQASEMSSVDGDDESEDAWGSPNDDAAEFSDEISSASEGPQDAADVDTSREDVSSDDVLGAASDSGSSGSTPRAAISARSQDRQRAGSTQSPPLSVKPPKAVPVKRCVQLCPARDDAPAVMVPYHTSRSGVYLYADCNTAAQLLDRVDEFLSLPGMRAVIHWLAKHFSLLAFQAASPAVGRHRAPAFRGDGWDIMLNFSGACWDAEMMSDALRLCLSGISVAEIVMTDRF